MRLDVQNLPDLFLATALKGAAFAAARVAPILARDNAIERIPNLKFGEYQVGRSVKPKLLDIYRPKAIPAGGLPIALVVHGGGFRFFSKDSHATVAVQMARAGYLTFTVDYRLAPEHPFPAGLTDVLQAYDWVLREASQYGANSERPVVIGESAGANLLLSLNLHLFGIEKLESSEVPVFPTDISRFPKKAILHCGLMQVSQPERYRDVSHPVVLSRMRQIQRNYLPQSLNITNGRWGLADPLLILEDLAARGVKLPTGFPEAHIPIGGNDPILIDSERLAAVFKKLDHPAHLEVYPGQTHAFYTLTFRKESLECWDDIYRFLK